MGSCYLTTPLKSRNDISPSSFVPRYCGNAYNAYIFSGIIVSPTPIGNLSMTLLLLFVSFLYVSNILISSLFLDVGLPVPHFYTGI